MKLLYGDLGGVEGQFRERLGEGVITIMQKNRGKIKLKNLGVAREMYIFFHLKFMQGRQANCSIKP